MSFNDRSMNAVQIPSVRVALISVLAIDKISRTDGKGVARMARLCASYLNQFKGIGPQTLRSLSRVRRMQVVLDIPSTLPLLVADWNC